MRAHGYSRISDDPEGREVGVKRQEEDIRSLAKRLGWDLVTMHRDNDRSAYSGKARPAWEELIALVERGQVDAILAYSTSRLYRTGLRELARLLDLVKARPDIRIETVVSGPLNLSTADGRMMAGILASIDRGEAERTAERVKRARDARIAQGKYGGGKRPFGMNYGGSLVPEEAAVIRDAAERILRGESIRSVLADWDQRGIRTTRDNAWSSSAFRSMLMSPRLAGIHPETGERAEWPPTISRRDHQALVDLFADSARLRRRRGGRYLLTGLLWCGLCGLQLQGQPGGGRRKYVCRKGPSVHLSVTAEPLEVYVVDQATEHAPDYQVPSVQDPADDADILAKLDEADRKMEQWAAEAAAAGLRAADIAAGAGAIAAERAALESELEASRPPAWKWTSLVPEQVEADTRAWLEAVIVQVVVHRAESSGRKFEGTRVEISWR